MKVILKDDVKSLGKMGDTVNVADGYARNYLLPKGLAATANERNIRVLEHEKRIIEAKARKIKTAAQSLKEKLSGMVLTIKAKAGEEEKLFGSVTSMDIASALKAEGVELDRRKILLEEPIKRLGDYKVAVRLHPEETAELNIKVVPE